MKPSYIKLFSIIAISCLGLIVYSNTFQCSFHLDDQFSIVGNLLIRNIYNLRNIWDFWPSRFITCFTFALNYQIHQLNVLGYHIFNLIIHLGSAILVWWLMLLTFSTPALDNNRIIKYANLIALFAGLIFISHPIQTQGITYIHQRAASMATLFYLISLNLYVKFRLLLQKGGSRVTLRYYYSFSLASAIIAMFTKEITITLPLMICLYELSFFRTKRAINWKYLFPFLLTMLVIPLTLLLTKFVNYFGGMRCTTEFSFGTTSPWQYLLTQFRVMVTYIRLVFLPFNQNLDYDYPTAITLLSLPVLVSLFFLISILILAVRLFRNYKLISFGIFWFFLTHLPESSIMPQPDIIFEHRLYLPMVGYSIFLVSGLYYLFKEKRVKITVLVLCLLVIFYSILTFQRNKVWEDEFTLWSDAVRKSPYKARTYFNRGKAYQKKGNYNQAIADYNQAIQINSNYADAYNNRGNIYLDKGEFDQAISDYNKAIKLNSKFAKIIKSNLGYSLPYYNRAAAYYFKQEYDLAWEDLHKAESLGFDLDSNLLKELRKVSESKN